jgi:hypothetical protein
MDEGGMKRAQPERALQRATCELLDHAKIPYFAVPNGSRRNAIEGRNLKLAGMKAGVPDLIILPDCALELKAPKGRLSESQAGWLQVLANHGWRTSVASDLDQVTRIFAEWFPDRFR